MPDLDEVIVVGQLRATAAAIADALDKSEYVKHIGGFVILVLDKSGEYAAYESNANVTDEQVSIALRSAALDLEE